jgi:hypothetical protein
MRIVIGCVIVLSVAAPAAAQTLTPNLTLPPVRPKVVSLAGPRVGLTALSDGMVEKLRERLDDPPSMISQFGWQIEKAFYTSDAGVAAVSEWVMLLGGLERNMAIPSLSWLVGLRTASGAEFGVGPNVSPSGSALVLAAGVTLRSGFLNVPVNVAFVPSKHGSRVSVLTGFNMRGR